MVRRNQKRDCIFTCRNIWLVISYLRTVPFRTNGCLFAFFILWQGLLPITAQFMAQFGVGSAGEDVRHVDDENVIDLTQMASGQASGSSSALVTRNNAGPRGRNPVLVPDDSARRVDNAALRHAVSAFRVDKAQSAESWVMNKIADVSANLFSSYMSLYRSHCHSFPDDSPDSSNDNGADECVVRFQWGLRLGVGQGLCTTVAHCGDHTSSSFRHMW